MITNIFSLSLSIILSFTRLVIPPVANEFLRSARAGRFFSFLLLFAGFSCSLAAQSDLHPAEKKLDDNDDLGAYPQISSANTEHQEDSSVDNQWQCGYEIIVVKGPAGELIYAEVPLSCDPMADLYKGCFIQENVQ